MSALSCEFDYVKSRFPVDSMPKYEGLATLRVMLIHSLDLGKLKASF